MYLCVCSVSDVRCSAAQPVAASCSHLCYLLCPDGVSSLCRSLRAAEWIAWPKVRRSFDLPSTWILVEDTSPIWKPRTLRKKQSASPGAPSLPIGGHGETTFADLCSKPRELTASRRSHGPTLQGPTRPAPRGRWRRRSRRWAGRRGRARASPCRPTRSASAAPSQSWPSRRTRTKPQGKSTASNMCTIGRVWRVG